MFYRTLSNGKYRYYQKYFNEEEWKWKQVSVTLMSKSRQAQAQAKRLLEEKIEAAQNTLFGFSENITVSELLKEWLVIRKLELKESTFDSQLSNVRMFESAFGKWIISKVSGISIQKYLLSFKQWSAKYRNLNKSILNLFFSYCVKVGYIKDNPMSQVVLPKLKAKVEEIQLKREKYLSKQEMGSFLSHLWNFGKNITLNIVSELMCYTGLRSGEALGLTWDVIDFEKKVLYVKQTLQYKRRHGFYLSSPKTASSYREVSLPQRCLMLLEKLKHTSNSNFVFLTKNGLPINLTTFNNYLKRYFKAWGGEKSSVFELTSHVLRHSHISLLAEMGVSLKAIMDRVGHSDEKTTLSIYTHVTTQMKQDVAQRLEVEVNFG